MSSVKQQNNAPDAILCVLKDVMKRFLFCVLKDVMKRFLFSSLQLVP